jgi:2-iminobutanoate/2-iminopropanoate deaminase
VKAITSTKLPKPIGPFSMGMQVGNLVFISGQVGQDQKTGNLVDGGIEAQTEQVIANLKAVLEAAGKSLADVARVGVYLTTMNDFAAMNAIYAKHFTEPFPARTTIAVAGLPRGALVEMDAVVA